MSTPTHTTRSPLDRHPSPVAEGGARRSRATAALVLGIVALLGALLSPIIGWVAAAFAVTFGAKGRPDGRATAGIVLGVVAILLGLAQVALAVVLL